jgi:phosphoglycolate phosphatase
MNSMTNTKLIIIDLDGTLVDSVPDLAFSVNEMMERIGRPHYDESEVRNWVGNGVEKLVKRALTGDLDAEPSDADFQHAFPFFSESYARHNGSRSELYPGIEEGLKELAAEGYTLACVTNKAEIFTTPLLKGLGIHDRFELIICGDTLAKKKPDPMPLLHAAEVLSVSPAESLMIGDSISDVKAARAAGFGIICVPYGYNHGNDIRKAHPDAVISSLAELPALLRQAA